MKMTKRTPWNYQRPVISKATRALRTDGKALVVMATGLEKTLTSAWTMKRIGKLPGLFLVHNNAILSKARDKEYASVFPNLTFGTFNGQTKEIEGADIVFATLQTMHNHLEEFGPRYFKWLVFDESHHAHAQTYRKVVEYFKCLKLAMTATPDRMDRKDIRELFGKEIAEVSLEEAIAKRWLPPIEYHLMSDDSLNERYLRDIAKRVLGNGERIPLEQVKKRLFVKKREKKIAQIVRAHKQKAVVFCQNIRRADEFSKLLTNSSVYHSRRTRSENEDALQKLENGSVQLLCAVNAFNEGVDIPDIGLVVFARTTESETVFRQQMGRGLRPGKHKLLVLDFVANIDRIRMVKNLVDKIERRKGPGGGGSPQEMLVVSGRKFRFTFTKQIMTILQVADRLEAELYHTWQEASRVAQQLGIRSKPEYSKRYTDDARLPSRPADYSGFPGFPIFLGRRGRIYATWQEAGKAAQKLGISSSKEYPSKYKQDMCLPSRPADTYKDFPGFRVFIGKEKKERPYLTWQTASEAAISLGITSSLNYRKKCKQNLRLPNYPGRFYRDFPGWKAFLETRVYPTWKQASRAAIKLGIKTPEEYVLRFKEDRRLRRMVKRLYPDFPGWNDFLAIKSKDRFYPSWRSATKAARRSGIRNQREYPKKYKRDPKLPSNPRQHYADWPGWLAFLGTKRGK